jgi:hypothetical protein
MGIRFYCPNGHKLNVKEFQAGRKGICPFCGAKIQIPTESTRPSTRDEPGGGRAPGAAAPDGPPQGNSGEDDSASGPVSIAPPPGMDEGPAAAPTPIVSAPQGPGATAWPGSTAPATSAAPAAADPLTEAGNVVWYVRPPSGGQFGPAGGDIMRGWLAEGRISADSLVWREGWRDWREAGGVFPGLRPEQSPPASNPGSVPDADAALPLPRISHPKPRTKRTQEIVVIVVLAAAAIALIVVLFCLELFRK